MLMDRMRFSCWLTCLCMIWACQSASGPTEESSGALLATTYCSTCHLSPDPSHLDKHTWETYVLPRMGYMYGIYPHDSVRRQLFERNEGGRRVEKAGIFPEKSVLDQESWEAIQAYFMDTAPENLPISQASMPIGPLPGFKVHIPPVRMSPPSSTLVRIHDGGIYLGDVNTQTLYQLDEQLKIQRAAKVQKGAVALRETSGSLQVAVMGSFSPTDRPSGFLLELPFSPHRKTRKFIPGLQRPVDMDFGDLDGDGLEDVVLCEYAKWTGKLAWWKQLPDGSFQPQLLRNKPGAIQAHIRDWNGDGLLDILALFGQGDEGIFYYENEGGGKFRESALLTFPPSYGSSSFGLIDWDGDGREDLLYTAGDNADYIPVLKPYHGIRLYLNRAEGLQEHLFLPMHGAYGAQVRDFDADGDLDIAAISFFPDFAGDSTGGFRYFQNQGEDQFTSFTMPESQLGRWLVMDAGDYDKDGDDDVILGSLAFEVVSPGDFVQGWVERGIPFILLENTHNP